MIARIENSFHDAVRYFCLEKKGMGTVKGGYF